jgi:hypothetical protein
MKRKSEAGSKYTAASNQTIDFIMAEQPNQFGSKKYCFTIADSS